MAFQSSSFQPVRVRQGLLATENYRHRFSDELPQDEGRGVAWEANLIRNALYASPRSNEKFLTVQVLATGET